MRRGAHAIASIVCLLGLLMVPSCNYIAGSRETLDPEVGKDASPQSSFVFGYIDMDDAKPDLDWALLHRVEIGKETKVHPMRTKDGMFYLENVPQGSYFLAEFGGRKTEFFSAGGLIAFRPYFYHVGSDAKEHRFKIDKPGVYYLGTWKFKVIKTGIFENDKFDLDAVKEPGQKALLAKILEEAKGTPWEAKLRAHQKGVK